MKTLAREPDRRELAIRLARVRPDSTRRWGRMSAHQMICHLSDACRMATGEKPVSDASGLLQQTIIKWVALYVPLPWPPGILTRPEVDQLQGGTCPGDFAADLAELRSLLDVLATRDPGFAWARHPIFGRMSRRAWMRWAYLHTDHHLRQFGA